MWRHRVIAAVLFGLTLLLYGCSSSGGEGSATSAATNESTSDPAETTTPAVGATSTTLSGDSASTTTVSLSELVLTLNEVESGFDRPVLLVADPSGGPDFVVEQPGRIVRADRGQHAVAVDVTGDVLLGGEQGLLGLAFHPDFDTNKLAYISYTDRRGTSVVEQFEVLNGVFDIASRRVILTIEQPAPNHNGGMIAFGPRGYLWIGMGDGGAADDRFGNGQDSYTTLGAMLRIAVPGEGGEPYSIPELNPYADGIDGAREVYWTGLRNPWRFAFDQPGGGVGADVWIADVGQEEIEEIDLLHSDSSGANFGWPIMEGSSCFQSDACDTTGLTAPIVEYTHNDGCSVTGGYVYRGTALPELDGHYFYSDFCAGFLRSYSTESGSHDWTEMTGSIPQVSGFGIGGDGELYVVSLQGCIYRIERSG